MSLSSAEYGTFPRMAKAQLEVLQGTARGLAGRIPKGAGAELFLQFSSPGKDCSPLQMPEHASTHDHFGALRQPARRL